MAILTFSISLRGKHVVNASMQDAGRDRIYIPLPEEAARHRMLEHFLKEGPDGVLVTWFRL
jgi:hypothetical protein